MFVSASLVLRGRRKRSQGLGAQAPEDAPNTAQAETKPVEHTAVRDNTGS